MVGWRSCVCACVCVVLFFLYRSAGGVRGVLRFCFSMRFVWSGAGLGSPFGCRQWGFSVDFFFLGGSRCLVSRGVVGFFRPSRCLLCVVAFSIGLSFIFCCWCSGFFRGALVLFLVGVVSQCVSDGGFFLLVAMLVRWFVFFRFCGWGASFRFLS